MKLNEYLFKTETKQTTFAEMLDISRPHLTQIVSGKRKPSPKLAKKIIEATKGHVTLNELMFPEDFPTPLFEQSLKK